ncbi:MAG: cytochrome C oxidase subunit IV family protein [Acidimicrobiia bacterium]
MSDNATNDTPAEPTAPGGSTVMDIVHAVEAEHPAVFSKDAEGPMLPGQHEAHATPFEYVLIALLLCVITAFEVFLYYQEEHWSHTLIVGLLLPLSFVKFIIVASYYMHLKSDRRVYRTFFAIGGILAFIVFLIALTTLGGRLDAGALWGMLGIAAVAIALFIGSFAMKASRKA